MMTNVFFFPLVSFIFHELTRVPCLQELELKEGGEVFEKWRKPPVEPATKVFFFNLTNPTEFMQGQKPVFKQIGPYVYR